MPEYLAPGVFVEETAMTPNSIRGASTGTAAFVGPTLSGDTGNAPKLLQSYSDFERDYGGCDDLAYEADQILNRNYVAHAARSFFTNGGKQLYVARVQSQNSRFPEISDYSSALSTLSALSDISTVAFPGYSALYRVDEKKFSAIQQMLLAFVEQPGTFRFAILDAPPGASEQEVKTIRAKVDSSFAAMYYPWVTVVNPLAKLGSHQPDTINLPPSGFMCGIYARTDIKRGVYKAPAGEEVMGASDFESVVPKQLAHDGINPLIRFVARGKLVWGARTLSNDAEWKYINVRRYVNYLEQSIDFGTQWAVFEPNDEPLWARLRSSISNFLHNEWRNGGLFGITPNDAFFVRCDRSCMTQQDIDNGNVICTVGVAMVKPAEFMIFRIGHKTAENQRQS